MGEDQNELEGVPVPGDVIVDKYRVERVIGMGGMGCVVAATHLTLDQPVAIKFLLNRAARNPKNVKRFQLEAQAAAKIKSDHVAKVSDVGTLSNGTPYMVMEFLEGHDLAERLTQVGRVPADEAVRYVLQACEALAEAHNAGIVHRDLKPANLFLASAADGSVRVKVLDFGISKILAEPGSNKEDLTKTSALMGSPLYMSPEQMMSAKAADGRADIWALGCILFELISGQPPFIGNTLPEICSRILTAPPSKLSGLVGVMPGLEAAIERALVKAPEQRYQNLAELANALYPYGGELAARSANIVCRVLGAPHLAPASSELPALSNPHSANPHSANPHSANPHSANPFSGPAGSAGYSHPYASFSSTPQHASGSHQVQHAQSYPQAFAQSDPSMGNPALANHPSHASYPQGASTSQNHLTPIPFGHEVTSRSAVARTPGMHQGANTAAPVAQTMSEEYGRSRAPLFIALGVLLAGGIGAVAFFTLRDVGPTEKASASSAPAAASSSAQLLGDGPEPAPTTKAAEPEPAKAEPEPTQKAEPKDLTKFPTPPRPDPKPPQPKIDPVPQPKVDPKPDPGRGKDGDDQFN